MESSSGADMENAHLWVKEKNIALRLLGNLVLKSWRKKGENVKENGNIKGKWKIE
jgi:hypothetical protein